MLVYTFRTFPEVDTLTSNFEDVVVLGELKADIAKLQQRLQKQDVPLIIGVAATSGKTRVEPVAINRFNRTKAIRANGPSQLALHVPAELAETFGVADKPTWSFCNLAMYRLQGFIVDQGLVTKQVFVHLNITDIPKLVELLQA